MKIYLLVHEQDTDAAWGCDVKTFLDKQAAQDAMHKSWEESVKSWEYDSHEHHDEDEATCNEANAVLREDGDVESWRIEEQELDVRVAVRVKGGLVEDISANTDVYPDVYDLDVSDFPDEGEEDEADRKEEELEELIKSPGWRSVW